MVAFVASTAALAAGSRFDPKFSSDVHPADAADREILKALTGEKPSRFLTVHRNFLGDGTPAMIVTSLTRATAGDVPGTLVVAKETSGWKLKPQDPRVYAGYCRVIHGERKDILLCQTTYRHDDVVRTLLYTLDFTRPQPDSFFLDLRDTIQTSAPCRTWANLDSVVLVADDSLRVVVEYGREGAKAGREFSHAPIELFFALGVDGFAPTAASRDRVTYVTRRLHGSEDCSGVSRNW